MTNQRKQIKFNEIITLHKGKPPEILPYYGVDAKPYLTPEFLRCRSFPELAKPSSNAVFVDDGDTILLWDGSNAGECLQGRKGLLASTMAVVRHSDNFDKEYFFYSVKFWEPYLKGQTTGSGIPHIDKKVFGNLEIFLFEIENQKKIAAVLSTVDRAIAQTEALIAKQQRIKTGLMQDLLTKGIDKNGNIRSEAIHRFKDSPLGRIPEEWETPELKEVSQVIDPNPAHRYPPPTEIGIPIISTENFSGENGYELKNVQTVSFKAFQEQNDRCQYQENDIVFARKGRLGLARFYGVEKKIFSHTVVIFKPFNTESLYPNYLLWLVRSRSFFKEINKRMNSNSGVPTLGVEFLGAVPIPVPPPLEQKQISNLLSCSESKIEVSQNQLLKLKRQKTGLMQDLLSGKVPVTPLLEPSPVGQT